MSFDFGAGFPVAVVDLIFYRRAARFPAAFGVFLWLQIRGFRGGLLRRGFLHGMM